MLKMLNGNILIEEYDNETKFNIKDKGLSVKADVIATGPNVSEVEVGDIIYLSKYSGVPYKEYRIIEEHEIFGKEK